MRYVSPLPCPRQVEVGLCGAEVLVRLVRFVYEPELRWLGEDEVAPPDLPIYAQEQRRCAAGHAEVGAFHGPLR